jgi:uncharacterized protein (TIGR02246 family)
MIRSIGFRLHREGAPMMVVDERLAREIRAVLDGFEEAWNRGDPRAFAGWFTDRAAYISRSGALFDGRDEVALAHAEAFDGPQRGTQMQITPTRTQRLAEDVAVVHASVRTTRQHQPGSVDAIATVVMQRNADGWRVAAAHTTQLGAV